MLGWLFRPLNHTLVWCSQLHEWKFCESSDVDIKDIIFLLLALQWIAKKNKKKTESFTIFEKGTRQHPVRNLETMFSRLEPHKCANTNALDFPCRKHSHTVPSEGGITLLFNCTYQWSCNENVCFTTKINNHDSRQSSWLQHVCARGSFKMSQ